MSQVKTVETTGMLEKLPHQSDEDLDRQAAEVFHLSNGKSELSEHLDWRRGNDSDTFDADAFSATFDLYLPSYIALISQQGLGSGL